ncbi:MAG: hypothetical protein KDN22_33980 [Verrucomicrobiae bacterium]|nr:hypothetical protein [Verrucomicrobiae bacterium]
MRTSPLGSTESNGTFHHSATMSFYGTRIDPPLDLEVTFEIHRGRPVFRSAIDRRGVSHEIELLNQTELRTSFEVAHHPEPMLTVE